MYRAKAIAARKYRTLHRLRGLAVFTALLFWLAAPSHAEVPRHVYLLLDNSGSMRSQDPEFRIRDFVSNLCAQLAATDRLGIALFADRTTQLRTLQADTCSTLPATLAAVDYTGQTTQTADAIEFALRALKTDRTATPTTDEADPTPARSIILITDGIIDTGSTAQDLLAQQWLYGSLTEALQIQGIKVFGISLSSEGAFQMVQRLGQATGADYFALDDSIDTEAAMQTLLARLLPALEELAPKHNDTIAPDAPMVPASQAAQRLAIPATTQLSAQQTTQQSTPQLTQQLPSVANTNQLARTKPTWPLWIMMACALLLTSIAIAIFVRGLRRQRQRARQPLPDLPIQAYLTIQATKSAKVQDRDKEHDIDGKTVLPFDPMKTRGPQTAGKPQSKASVGGTDGTALQLFPIKHVETWIGRSRHQADVYIPGAQISTNHFKIIYNDNTRAFSIVDVSRNGTWLIRAESDASSHAQAATPIRLKHGDATAIHHGDQIVLPGFGVDQAITFNVKVKPGTQPLPIPVSDEHTQILAPTAVLKGSDSAEVPVTTITYLGLDGHGEISIGAEPCETVVGYIEQLERANGYLVYRLTSRMPGLAIDGRPLPAGNTDTLQHGTLLTLRSARHRHDWQLSRIVAAS